MSQSKLAKTPYSRNTYASPDIEIRMRWRRKTPIPKDIVGREVYFMPFKYMDMKTLIDLTPNNLYTITGIQKLGNMLAYQIIDDKGDSRLIWLDRVESIIDSFPWFIVKLPKASKV